MPYVQTQTKAVIAQKALAKAVDVAFGDIFKQQRYMTVFFPVMRKARQQTALDWRRSPGRVQHSAARLKKGGLFQHPAGKGGQDTT